MEFSEGVKSIKFIGCRAFHKCKKLETVLLPRSIDFISSDAFHGCGSLTEILVPRGMKKRVKKMLSITLKGRVKEN